MRSRGKSFFTRPGVRNHAGSLRVRVQQPNPAGVEVLYQPPVGIGSHRARPDHARRVDVRLVIDPFVGHRMIGQKTARRAAATPRRPRRAAGTRRVLRRGGCWPGWPAPRPSSGLVNHVKRLEMLPPRMGRIGQTPAGDRIRGKQIAEFVMHRRHGPAQQGRSQGDQKGQTAHQDDGQSPASRKPPPAGREPVDQVRAPAGDGQAAPQSRKEQEELRQQDESQRPGHASFARK